MSREEVNSKILQFFENIEKYYGCKTEITEGIYSGTDSENADLATWNISEFNLVRSAYRKKGNRFMIEGKGRYYEISAENIISLEQPGRNKFEFIEQYGNSVFRITKIKFHYKY